MQAFQRADAGRQEHCCYWSIGIDSAAAALGAARWRWVIDATCLHSAGLLVHAVMIGNVNKRATVHGWCGDEESHRSAELVGHVVLLGPDFAGPSC